MKIKIEFFENDFINAIGAGIYKIIVASRGKKEILYIGESVFVLVRCAAHLYELKRNHAYFGFTDEQIKDEGITLRFELAENQIDAAARKRKEKELIRENNPIMQSGISDRMKSVEEKIEALTNFLQQEDQ